MRAPFYSFSYFCCFLVVLALCHCCLSGKNSSDVLCIEKERVALLKFKHDLVNGANRLTTWVSEEDDCCKWGGIVCNNLTGHVLKLHLRGPDYHDYRAEAGDEFYTQTQYDDYVKAQDEKMRRQKLGGKINPSLLSLEQLEFLDLSLNDFGGIRIPSFIGSLRNLRHFNISEAQFSMEIPHQLRNLSRLQVLSLERIHSDDTIQSAKSLQWLSGLPMLQRLYLSEVNLSGAHDWLQVINTLPSLIELHLSECSLPLIPPDHLSIANRTSLSVLDLSYNNLGTSSSLRRWIFSLHRLVSLNIRGCVFHDMISGNNVGISNLTSLRVLLVSGNQFVNSSLTMKELSSLGDSLVSLEMGYCGLSSPILADLRNMTSLVNLDLSSNDLTERIRNSFGNFCNLKHIDLSGNHFGGLSLSGVLNSLFECRSSKLESLKVIFSNMSGHLPYQLRQLKHLVSLELGSNSISGSLLDSVKISSLKVLDLQYNLIFGTVPKSIGLLSSLESLNLKSNSISGPIPYSIGQLSSLRQLDLSSNTFSGLIPHSIGRLLSLETLDISRNRLNGSIPRCIGQLWKLKHLDIAENLLTGIMTKDHLANLTRLKRFRADHNSLTITVDWVPSFQLVLLGLNSVSLGPRFPLWLQWQRSLYHLDMANTGISDSMPSWFWSRFPGLTYLNVSRNQMQVNLSRIPTSLQVLDANSINFRGPLPALPNGTMIRFLDLSDNMFFGSLKRLLCPRVQTVSLHFLNLANNNLSGVIPECWEKWQDMWFLNLENNNLSGRIPSSLGSTNLNFLNLCKNKLFGRLPDSMMNLTNLEILLLAENDFKGNIPTWIGTKLQSLKILKLRSNKFVGDISDELCLLTSMQILDLARNNLSGHIPACFSNFSVMSGKEHPLANNIFLFDFQYGFTFLGRFWLLVKVQGSASLLVKGREDTYSGILGLVTMLDLSCNFFSGHIPRDLTSLVTLQSLNLSRNHLTGSIPETVGDMTRIESIDLSMNQLSAEIPLSLSNLSFLNHLNVSYNNLSGRIPSSTQLQTIDNSSFVGNKLCGPPLTRRCGVSEDYGRGEGVKEGTNRPDWGLLISIMSGIALGFWVVVAPLTISRSWRIVYFRIVDKARYRIYDITRKYCCNAFGK